MKRFLVILFILLILGGVAFFFGWLNLFIPADAYVVVQSKLFPENWQEVVKGNEFRWTWENLLPTNLTLHIFKPEVYSKNMGTKGSFPSGKVFASIMPGNPEFSYDINFLLSIQVNFNSLPRLVNSGELKPETLDDWYAKQCELIFTRILYYLRNLKADEVSLLMDPYSLGQELNNKLGDYYPHLKIVDIVPVTIQVPDPDLYLQAKKNYLALAEQIKEQDYSFNQKKEEFSPLEYYGKLLTEYPILLKYLYLNKLSGEELLKLPELEIPDILEELD